MIDETNANTEITNDGRGRKKEHPIRKIDPNYESSFTTHGKTFTEQDKLWTFIDTLSNTQLKNDLFVTVTNRRYELDQAGKTKPTKKVPAKKSREKLVKRY